MLRLRVSTEPDQDEGEVGMGRCGPRIERSRLLQTRRGVGPSTQPQEHLCRGCNALGLIEGFVGEQHQQLLGFNPTGGVNLRVTFLLRRAANR